jgi:hypothetical protein
MPARITEGQSVTITAKQADGQGNEVEFDPANIVWSSSDSTIFTVKPNDDGTAKATSTGKLGSAQVMCKEGNLTTQETITVVSGAADSLTLSFGEPENAEAPEAPPVEEVPPEKKSA